MGPVSVINQRGERDKALTIANLILAPLSMIIGQKIDHAAIDTLELLKGQNGPF